MMNQFRTVLAAGAATAALALAVPALAHPDHQPNEQVREIKIVKADGKTIGKSEMVADCGKGRKFESSAEAGEGTREKRVSKMVICSDPGESDAAWEKTLRDALARIEGSDDLPAEGKSRIIADLNAEIARIGK